MPTRFITLPHQIEKGLAYCWRKESHDKSLRGSVSGVSGRGREQARSGAFSLLISQWPIKAFLNVSSSLQDRYCKNWYLKTCQLCTEGKYASALLILPSRARLWTFPNTSTSNPPIHRLKLQLWWGRSKMHIFLSKCMFINHQNTIYSKHTGRTLQLQTLRVSHKVSKKTSLMQKNLEPVTWPLTQTPRTKSSFMAESSVQSTLFHKRLMPWQSAFRMWSGTWENK